VGRQDWTAGLSSSEAGRTGAPGGSRRSDTGRMASVPRGSTAARRSRAAEAADRTGRRGRRARRRDRPGMPRARCCVRGRRPTASDRSRRTFATSVCRGAVGRVRYPKR
jgi:hypothetical protein